MVRLCMSFFTNDMIRTIRSKKRGFDIQNWYLYRTYHQEHTMERVNSGNAIFLFREFQNACETIASFQDESHVRMFLSCRNY
jgi:hypothetical protein